MDKMNIEKRLTKQNLNTPIKFKPKTNRKEYIKYLSFVL